MKITAILMGGARRVTLAEQIKKLVTEFNLEIEFISIERDGGFYPISQMGKCIPAPNFLDQKFDAFFHALLSQIEWPLILACMDSALPSLSELRGRKIRNSTVVGPTKEGARVALDKGLTDDFCARFDILHPARYRQKLEKNVTGKVIAKPLQGFGGKGIAIYESIDEVNDSTFNSHIVQQFINGPETTHDLYIASNGKVYASSRDRLAVIDGEVDHCVVRLPTDKEVSIFKKISDSGLFYGPITVQTINFNGDIFLIEINARFGGGVTASVAAGFPGIELLLFETFGIKMPHKEFKNLEMKRARRDFYRLLNGN